MLRRRDTVTASKEKTHGAFGWRDEAQPCGLRVCPHRCQVSETHDGVSHCIRVIMSTFAERVTQPLVWKRREIGASVRGRRRYHGAVPRLCSPLTLEVYESHFWPTRGCDGSFFRG